MKKDSLGILRIASVHVFVHDLERSRRHFIDNLDFAEVAVSTPDFEEEHGARASAVQAGNARFVFMEPRGTKGESSHWLNKHPEGVGRVVFDVQDAEKAFAILTSRHATPVTGLERRNVDGGMVTWFDIATPIGDTLFRFIQHVGHTPVMPDMVRVDPPPGGSNRFGITEVDHLTSNFLTLAPAISWMENVMGLERHWSIDFHTQDVRKGNFAGSGLKSIVMWDPQSAVKFANNEPAAPFFKASQIYLFCEDHHGAGIQHVALSVGDITKAVAGIRQRGAHFMPTAPAYYDMLPQRLLEHGIIQLDEDVETLRRLEILVDGSAAGQYLLQIFMPEASALFADPKAGPLFIELIQRKGDSGFGGGNFRALFESIERTQQADGRK